MNLVHGTLSAVARVEDRGSQPVFNSEIKHALSCYRVNASVFLFQTTFLTSEVILQQTQDQVLYFYSTTAIK